MATFEPDGEILGLSSALRAVFRMSANMIPQNAQSADEALGAYEPPSRLVGSSESEVNTSPLEAVSVGMWYSPSSARSRLNVEAVFLESLKSSPVHVP